MGQRPGLPVVRGEFSCDLLTMLFSSVSVVLSGCSCALDETSSCSCDFIYLSCCLGAGWPLMKPNFLYPTLSRKRFLVESQISPGVCALGHSILVILRLTFC